MLCAKMKNYSQAIHQLDGLLNFVQYEKVDDGKGGWMSSKIM